MFNASTTNGVVIGLAAFQPTSRREYTSMMNATYTMPDQAGFG